MSNVRVGSRYVYDPVLLDHIDGRTSLQTGDVVTVMNLPGCPRAGVMAHCHVALNGRFAGLVHVNSLAPIRSERAQQVLYELKSRLAAGGAL